MNNEKEFEFEKFEEPFDTAQGKEKKEIATTPPTQAKVRTMQSDLKSLQESGGQTVQPYSIEIDHPAAPEKKKIKGLFIVLGILVLILIIVLGLIWLI